MRPVVRMRQAVRSRVDARVTHIGEAVAAEGARTRAELDAASASAKVERLALEEALGAAQAHAEQAYARLANAEEALQSLHGLVSELTVGEHERHFAERMGRLASATVAQLDEPAADLIAYASSHRGFAGQAGLWLNPPLVLGYGPGRVELATVNERIVEVPYAFRALAGVPIGGRVLDFGAAESSVALSLATMGYAVTALDLSVYPFRHPRLEVVSSPLEHWEIAAGGFDAALVISAVEHVGLGWYGEPPGRLDDVGAMARLRELVRPGGLVVLTVPYGTPGVDAVQRRYDRAGVDALVAGFAVEDRRVLAQTGPTTWEAAEEDATGEAVALLTLRVPPVA